MSDDELNRLRAALAAIEPADPQTRMAARERLALLSSNRDLLPETRVGRARHATYQSPRRLAVVTLVVASLVAVAVVAVVRGTAMPHRAAPATPRRAVRTNDYQTLEVTSAAQPSPRDLTQMVYFPPDKEVVLLGGMTRSGKTLGDTWVFDRHGWRELHLPVSPPARAEAAMAYDPNLKEIVLYGGCGICGGPRFRQLYDTWAFNGSQWQELHSKELPTYEPSPVMSWDDATGELEMLAPPPGYGAGEPKGVFYANASVALGRWTWTHAGWTWDGRAPGPPLTIQLPAFVNEPGSSNMLYYFYKPDSSSCNSTQYCGRSDPHGIVFSQTWTFDGRSFVKNHPLNAPRSPAVVVADTRTGRVVTVAQSSIWTWNGTTWLQKGSRVPFLYNEGGAYDAALGDVVVFGVTASGPPRSTTWVWNGAAAHRVSP